MFTGRSTFLAVTPLPFSSVCHFYHLVQQLVLSHVEQSSSPSRQDPFSLLSRHSDNDIVIVIVSSWTKVLFVLCTYHGDIISSFYKMDPADIERFKHFQI